MSNLDADIRAANELGLSYGYYMASKYDPSVLRASPTIHQKKKRHHERRYTDQQLFQLWQEGKNDIEIGKAVGVSRQLIQRWRDQMELPTTFNSTIDTQKYRLATLQDGTPIVIQTDEL